MNIFEEIKSLGFSPDKFIVLGGSAIAAYGLREAADIDLFVTDELFEQCKNAGWEVRTWDDPARTNDLWLRKGKFELYNKFWYEDKYYSFQELLPYTRVIQGLQISPIYWLMNWKKLRGKPKDVTDVVLIGQYLQMHPELIIEPK